MPTPGMEDYTSNLDGLWLPLSILERATIDNEDHGNKFLGVSYIMLFEPIAMHEWYLMLM